jgi:DNA gyrase/topoisomerase IV subunit A
MKIGELADLLRELDIFTERYIDQKDWIGRFEARGETHKAEQQKQRIDEIQQKIMALRDKELTPTEKVLSQAEQREMQQQQAIQEDMIAAAMETERKRIIRYLRKEANEKCTLWTEVDRSTINIVADRINGKWHWEE